MTNAEAMRAFDAAVASAIEHLVPMQIAIELARYVVYRRRASVAIDELLSGNVFGLLWWEGTFAELHATLSFIQITMDCCSFGTRTKVDVWVRESEGRQL